MTKRTNNKHNKILT